MRHESQRLVPGTTHLRLSLSSLRAASSKMSGLQQGATATSRLQRLQHKTLFSRAKPDFGRSAQDKAGPRWFAPGNFITSDDGIHEIKDFLPGNGDTEAVLIFFVLFL